MVLQALWNQTTRTAGGWIVELDIRKYFDSIDHGRLRMILRRRVRDGVLLRLIGKWLKAGVLEDGAVSYPRSGSPQGGVVSPILANIFLHEVLDVWFQEVVQPRMRGQARLVRYADDAVLIFERFHDAERVMAVLPRRFGKYGLTLHPAKTRIVEFVRPDTRRHRVGPDASARPGSFDFLGFTHYWGKSRKGKWIAYRRTARDRFRRALKQVAQWCQRHRHDDLRVQQRILAWKLRGHFGYYGIVGNFAALQRFHREVERVWCKWLRRRSQRARKNWDVMATLMDRYALPQPRGVSPAYRVANS